MGVHRSINNKGEASYYHAHPRGQKLPEEQRIVSGGEPQKIAEAAEKMPEPKGFKQKLNDEGENVEAKPEKHIYSYSWGDERDTIKIYLSADNESDAVSAAADGKGGQVEVDWKPRFLKMRIHGEKYDYIFELERI